MGILCLVLAVGIAIAIPVAIHDFKASQCASSGKDCQAAFLVAAA